MTAHELARELLAGPDLPVHQQYCYGDHGRTQVAPEINRVTAGRVKHSEYHQMPRVVAEESEDEDGVFTCRECGGPARLNPDETTNHVSMDDTNGIDYDADVDHVAIKEEDESQQVILLG